MTWVNRKIVSCWFRFFGFRVNIQVSLWRRMDFSDKPYKPIAEDEL